MAGDQDLGLRLTRQDQLAVREAPWLEGRVDPDNVVTVLELLERAVAEAEVTGREVRYDVRRTADVPRLESRCLIANEVCCLWEIRRRRSGR